MARMGSVPHVTLPADMRPSEGLAVLRQGGAAVAVVHHRGRGWTVVDEASLKALSSREQPLAELQDELPPLISIDHDELSDDETVALARLLHRTGARGAVRWHGQHVHAYSRAAVRGMLGAVPGGQRIALGDDASQLQGLASVTAPIFVCQRCQPNRYEIPRLGNERPVCDVHGPMEPYYL